MNLRFVMTAYDVVNALCAIVGPSFGPEGFDKALVTATNKIVVSNRACPLELGALSPNRLPASVNDKPRSLCGFTILQALVLSHPVANLVLE